MTINSYLKAFQIHEKASALPPQTGCLGWLGRLVSWGGGATTRLQVSKNDSNEHWVACRLERPSFWKSRFTAIHAGIDGKITQIWVNNRSWKKRLHSKIRSNTEIKKNPLKGLNTTDGEEITLETGQSVLIPKEAKKDFLRHLFPQLVRRYLPSRAQEVSRGTVGLSDLTDEIPNVIKAFVTDIASHLPKDKVELLLPKILAATSTDISREIHDFALERIAIDCNIPKQYKIMAPSVSRSFHIDFTSDGDAQVRWVFNISSFSLMDLKTGCYLKDEDGNPQKYESPFSVSATVTLKADGNDEEDTIEMTFEEGQKPEYTSLIFSREISIFNAMQAIDPSIVLKEVNGQLVSSVFWRDIDRDPYYSCLQKKYNCLPENDDEMDSVARRDILTRAFLSELPEQLKDKLPKITAALNQNSFIILQAFAMDNLPVYPAVQDFLQQHPGFKVYHFEEGERGFSVQIEENGDVIIEQVLNVSAIKTINLSTNKVAELEFPFYGIATITLKANGNGAEDTFRMTIEESL